MKENKKENVFNIDNLVKQATEKYAQNQNNFVGVSSEATLILAAINNLQLGLNSIIVQVSAFLYAMRKEGEGVYDLMQIGVMISEYVNRKIQLDQYRAMPMGIDLQVSVQMEEAIRELSLQLAEKGSEYLEDAIAEYERFTERKKKDEQ